ncbi:hypothetical protein GQ42DRAFT_155797 [Ramicandelaber brevisporus]|nr:hypothetical protein GQ42DRAFT_155797 [Ramicandelaber brevisporus]
MDVPDMPTKDPQVEQGFSQFVKLGEKNAHDTTDLYSPVPNPSHGKVPARSYFSRIISILRHIPSLLMQNTSSSNPPPETNQSDHVSIAVGDQTPAPVTPPPTTAVDLMDVINKLSTILTSEHDISKLQWGHPKFMNQKHCGSFLDNTSVAILMLHYGIEQDLNGTYVNKKNRDIETLQQAIHHLLLLAITTDDNEINKPETTPFRRSGTSPKIISSAKNIRKKLGIFTRTMVNGIIKMRPEEDLSDSRIEMLARVATICFILTKKKSTTIIKKLLEIEPRTTEAAGTCSSIMYISCGSRDVCTSTFTTRRAIVNFSDAASVKYACVGCQTAALLEFREEVSKLAAGPYVNLIGQPSSTSKESSMLIDRPGTTSCLHRAGFYFIEAYSLFLYEPYVKNDVVENNVRTYTIKPSVLSVGCEEYGRLTWLEKPILVNARSTSYTPVHLIG